MRHPAPRVMSCIAQPAVVPWAILFIVARESVMRIPAFQVAPPTIIGLKPVTAQGAWMDVWMDARTPTPTLPI